MTKLIAALFCCVLFCADPLQAHEDDIPIPVDSDDLVVPTNISVLEFARLTRFDHRLVLHRMLEKGDKHHVGTMSRSLSIKALEAGRENPRAAGNLLWQMSQIAASADRAAALERERLHLEQLAIDLDAKLAGMTPEDEARQMTQNDVDTVAALLALVLLWQNNPMDGAGS